MSNEEKKKRREYIQNRNKWIIIQSIIIGIVLLLGVISTVTYSKLDKEYFIEYTETGSVDYKVYLHENDFYDKDYLEKDQSYIVSLIDDIKVDFDYNLNLATDAVDYNYSYQVDATVEILDKSTNAILYEPSVPLTNKVTKSASDSNSLEIKETVSIDYAAFNKVASDFNSVYDLSNIASSLVVKFHVSVISTCDEFENDNNNEYVITLTMPLCVQTTSIDVTTTAPSGESKILACNTPTSYQAYKVLAIVAYALDIALVIVLVCYIYFTRNTDINYNNKVKKIVNSYKSFIQCIKNEFNSDGYQVIVLNTFNEMLEIRDIILSPILMFENDDKTRSTFVIPTNTKILYQYEIKIEDYDEIYNRENAENEVQVETEVVEVEKETVKVTNDKITLSRNKSSGNSFLQRIEKPVEKVIPVEEAIHIMEEVHRDEVNATEVNEIVSDAVAKALIEVEDEDEIVLGDKKGIINLDIISENHEAEEVVTVNSLKEKKLINENVGYLKVLARGTLNKPLTIKAHKFSIEAAKMIEITGGRVIKIKK